MEEVVQKLLQRVCKVCVCVCVGWCECVAYLVCVLYVGCDTGGGTFPPRNHDKFFKYIASAH